MPSPAFGRKNAPVLPEAAVTPFLSSAARRGRWPVDGWIDAAVNFLFDTKGRVSRWQFRFMRLAMVVIGFGVYQVALQTTADLRTALAAGGGLGLPVTEMIAVYLTLGLTFWCNIVVTIKRWHDLDKSAWWVLLGFVPVIGWIWQIVQCAAVAGTPGVNRYGPRP